MRVRQLDANHDWTFGKGRNDYLQGNPAVAQNINTRLNSFLGDCFFDLTAGVDWFNMVGGKDQLALNLAISAIILNTADVIKMVQLDVVLTENRDFIVTYVVDTVYSRVYGTFTTGAEVAIELNQGGLLTQEDGYLIYYVI